MTRYNIKYLSADQETIYARIQAALNDLGELVGRDFKTDVGLGLVPGYDYVNKFGRNPDVDTATTPEDVWNGGGVYTGFPVGAPEELTVVSSSASDTGVVYFTYLASSASTEYLVGSAVLNGTTPVNTGIMAYRVHTGRYDTGDNTTFNVGEITCRHRTTVTNVFFKMPIGRSQTNAAGYTVPAGHTGYVTRLFSNIYKTTAGSITGALWVRNPGDSPRLRRPFSCSDAGPFEEFIDGGIEIASGSDITVRILTASANNLEVVGGYDLLVKDNNV